MTAPTWSPWTPEEDSLLAKVWPEMGRDCLHLFPNRTLSALRTRVSVLQVKRANRKRAQCRPRGEPSTYPVTRIEFHDDEPLVIAKRDRRNSHCSFGFIRTGAAPSVWHFASAIGATAP